ncbi:MAG: hydroxymethylglutaryl-CoA lyase [Thermodesulforhabdaceae bacterium]
MNIEKLVLEDQTLRDGIQRENTILSTDEKLDLIKEMISCGLKRFQITSFVNPKKVPQMADAEELISRVQAFTDISFFALILNTKGLERALKAGCSNVEISISASHSHGLKNVGMGFSDTIDEFDNMLRLARKAKAYIKVSIQCAFGCQYEGAISEKVVVDLVMQGLDGGAHEVSLADTTGMAFPELVMDRVAKIKEMISSTPLFLHLHDTDGKGISNVVAGIKAGVRHFDATLGGTGGCPFIPNAHPNVALESLVEVAHQMGFETGIDKGGLDRVREKLIYKLKRVCSVLS